MILVEDITDDRVYAIDYAIRNKYQLMFWYRGNGVLNRQVRKDGKRYLQNWRIVEPVSYGYSKKNRLIMRAWQIKGISNTTKPEWKTFLVDEMTRIKVMDGSKLWGPSNRYAGFDKPSGYNFNPTRDKSMKGGKPITIIDLNKIKGADLSKMAQEEKPEENEFIKNNTREEEPTIIEPVSDSEPGSQSGQRGDDTEGDTIKI